MGFFDKMKQAVGIGGAKIDISLDDGLVPLGGFAKGRVVLRGGKGEQKCDAIEARLERVTTIRVQVEDRMQDKDEIDTIQSEKLANYQFTISPESEQAFDFAFKVPREGGPGTRIKYRIFATADIPGAIDPSKTVELSITDAAPAAMGLGDVPSLLQTAKTLREQGGSDKSVEIEALLGQVLALDANHAQALRMLAEVVGWRNEAEAVPYWHKYLALVPADTEAWEELARNAERRGATAEALQTFDKALALAPNRSYLHAQRARVLETMNRDDEAIGAWDQALRGDSPDQGYAISRAKVLVKQGRRAEAETALLAIGESCESYHLDDVLTALVELGASQHEEQLISRALERNLDNAFTIHEIHAQRLFKRGAYAKSLEAVDRALKGPSHSPWTLSNLIALKGQSLEQLDRRADAKAAYKKALDINKDNYEAKTRLKAL